MNIVCINSPQVHTSDFVAWIDDLVEFPFQAHWWCEIHKCNALQQRWVEPNTKIFQTAMHNKEIAVDNCLAWPTRAWFLYRSLPWSSFIIDNDCKELPIVFILVEMSHFNIATGRAAAMLVNRAVSILIKVPNPNSIKIFPVWNTVWELGSKIICVSVFWGWQIELKRTWYDGNQILETQRALSIWENLESHYNGNCVMIFIINQMSRTPRGLRPLRGQSIQWIRAVGWWWYALGRDQSHGWNWSFEEWHVGSMHITWCGISPIKQDQMVAIDASSNTSSI